MGVSRSIVAASLLFLSISSLTACGARNVGDPVNTILDSTADTCGDSKVIGAYRRNAIGGSERITFGSTCSGFSDYCGYSFTFHANKITSDTLGSTGAMGLSVTGSNNLDGCIASGNYPGCSYTTSPTTGLTLTCGSQTYSFAHSP